MLCGTVANLVMLYTTCQNNENNFHLIVLLSDSKTMKNVTNIEMNAGHKSFHENVMQCYNIIGRELKIHRSQLKSQ